MLIRKVDLAFDCMAQITLEFRHYDCTCVSTLSRLVEAVHAKNILQMQFFTSSSPNRLLSSHLPTSLMDFEL